MKAQSRIKTTNTKQAHREQVRTDPSCGDGKNNRVHLLLYTEGNYPSKEVTSGVELSPKTVQSLRRLASEDGCMAFEFIQGVLKKEIKLSAAKNQEPARIVIAVEGSNETFDVEICDGLFNAIQRAALRLGIAPGEFVSEAMAQYLKRWRSHAMNRQPSRT